MNDAINELVNTFNNSWLSKDLVSLRAILHEEVVFMAPDMKSSLKGREACIGTIEAYINQADTRRFNFQIDAVHIIGQTAWLTLSYDIDYKMNRKFYHEQGVEVWGVLRQNDRWLLAWRCLARRGEQNRSD